MFFVSILAYRLILIYKRQKVNNFCEIFYPFLSYN
nr:MAG TPA: hypothetical protein [Caudoviricetes sp.]